MFLPVSDQIIGRYYFDYLCKTEGGLHVYETVNLGSEYYYMNGSPIFIDSEGKFDASALNDRYEFRKQSQENYAKLVRIKKRTDLIVDLNTGKTLGTHTRFFFGGWLANNFSHHTSGIICKGYSVGGGKYEEFLKYVFKSSLNPNKSLKHGTAQSAAP